MDLSIADLADKPIVFVSGKGGVGKSTTAASLALVSAANHQRTLLVECFDAASLSDFFAFKTTSYKARALQPHLDLVQINFDDAFHEFILKYIKSEFIYRSFFNRTLVRNFMEGAPGLNELITIDKIWELHMQGGYDKIIIDLPATGHAMALLSVAGIIKNAISMGPMFRAAQQIYEFLHDKQLCSYLIVTLNQQLALTEALEFKEKLIHDNFPEPVILLNMFFPQLLVTAPKNIDSKVLQHYQLMQQLNTQALNILQNQKSKFAHFHLRVDFDSALDLCQKQAQTCL